MIEYCSLSETGFLFYAFIVFLRESWRKDITFSKLDITKIGGLIEVRREFTMIDLYWT